MCTWSQWRIAQLALACGENLRCPSGFAGTSGQAGGLQAEAVEGSLAEFKINLGPCEERYPLDPRVGRMEHVLMGGVDQALDAFMRRFAGRAGAEEGDEY